MELMMRRAQSHNSRITHSHGPPSPKNSYLEQTAHSVEVRREMNERGELGSYGFILIEERPPFVSTVVPDGPADKAGLKKKDVVVAVNNNDITNLSHQEVVNIIARNRSPGIWLTVCEPNDSPNPRYMNGGSPISRINSPSLSISTPSIHRGHDEPRRIYARDDSPPKYSDPLARKGKSLTSSSLSVTTPSINISPLAQVKRTQSNGLSSSENSINQQGTSPANSASAFTSANVLVLYIGAVEIPLTWRVRELSSRCLQECTRQLLSQRQEFLEVFLEVNLKSLRILKVDQAPLFVHPREELFYCGVCTDDEQYFGVVTKKEQKGSKKGNGNGHQTRAHMCHVFKVMQSKSVLVLRTGESKPSPRAKSASTSVKPKTIPITSCVTIINALQGLFTTEDLSSSKLLSDSTPQGSSDQSLKIAMSMSSFGSGSSVGSLESVSSSEKAKKKLDVVDLRPTAFSPKSRFLLTQSVPSNPNMYVAQPQHSRSLSKEDFPLATVTTPAYIHQKQNSGSAPTWYKADSPKENFHSRENSWDNRESRSRPSSGSYEKHAVLSSSSGRGSRGSSKANQLDYLSRKISDDSSMSSLSDPRDSPIKLHYKSRSRSPSPMRSLSYSSGSRSPSPRRMRSPSPGPVSRVIGYQTPSVSKLSAGLALESTRYSRAQSPVGGGYRRGSGLETVLRRNGSESSIMEAQDYQGTLPPKNSCLTSSFGSVATLTTVADEEVNDPDECGRVAAWVASFDRLLSDPMGVQCLLYFLEKEHCEENILFWREAQNFKLNMTQNTNITEAVRKIYDQYLSPTSPSTVNVDDRVMKGVESKLANPPPNIFNEAQDQIYRLMKMDCYPRFKKSDIVKQCLMAEMEGKPLPIDSNPPEKQDQSQYNGIWKKTRERGIRGSLFSKFGRKVHNTTPPFSVYDRPEKSSPENVKKKKKEKKTHGGSKHSKPKGGDEQHNTQPVNTLDMFQAHKRNVFEVNLPNKVNKIMEVPDGLSVREAIQPVLKKYGYDFEIMELRFASTFRPIKLSLPATVLIGQHVLVAKSRNTFIATFPDQLDKILPADGSQSVGELFVSVLRDMEKLQNFQVYCEGSRVPLELGVDTSVLVGQKVNVKFLPGPCTFTSANQSKSSLNSSNDSSRNDIEDLFSKIESLQCDTLSDQRISPTPHSTPEPDVDGQGRSYNNSPSPKDQRRRTLSIGKRSQNNERVGHKMLTVSKSIGVMEHKNELYVPQYNNLRTSSKTQFKRVQSGSSITSQRKAHIQPPRSKSPPAGVSYEEARRRSNISPPPPTTKPPPLPESKGGRHHSRWSAGLKTDSASSEDSDRPRSDRGGHRHGQHIYENRVADTGHYFPQAYPSQSQSQSQIDGPIYANGPQEKSKSYARNRPSNAVSLSSLAKERNPRPSMMPSPPRDEHHPLDNVVTEAHHKKLSGQKRNIQTATNISSYPWHNAHNNRKTSGGLTSSRQRKYLTENTDLIRSGNEIIQRDLEEFHSDRSSSGSNRTPVSPTTHTLTLPEEQSCETFV